MEVKIRVNLNRLPGQNSGPYRKVAVNSGLTVSSSCIIPPARCLDNLLLCDFSLLASQIEIQKPPLYSDYGLKFTHPVIFSSQKEQIPF